SRVRSASCFASSARIRWARLLATHGGYEFATPRILRGSTRCLNRLSQALQRNAKTLETIPVPLRSYWDGKNPPSLAHRSGSPMLIVALARASVATAYAEKSIHRPKIQFRSLSFRALRGKASQPFWSTAFTSNSQAKRTTTWVRGSVVERSRSLPG